MFIFLALNLHWTATLMTLLKVQRSFLSGEDRKLHSNFIFWTGQQFIFMTGERRTVHTYIAGFMRTCAAIETFLFNSPVSMLASFANYQHTIPVKRQEKRTEIHVFIPSQVIHTLKMPIWDYLECQCFECYKQVQK